MHKYHLGEVGQLINAKISPVFPHLLLKLARLNKDRLIECNNVFKSDDAQVAVNESLCISQD